MNGALSPAGDPHPGEIAYDDRIEQRAWTKCAAEVPSTIAWVQSGAQWKPVVRIEITGAGGMIEIKKFGPNHEFLESTMSAPPPPPPRDPEPTPTPTKQ